MVGLECHSSGNRETTLKNRTCGNHSPLKRHVPDYLSKGSTEIYAKADASTYTIQFHCGFSVRVFCKEKNSKNPRLLWKWVGGSDRSHSEFVVVGKIITK